MTEVSNLKLTSSSLKKYITYIPVNSDEVNTILSLFGNRQAFILNKGKIKQLFSNLQPIDITLSTEPYDVDVQKLYSIDFTGVNLAGNADITLQFFKEGEEPQEIVLEEVPLGNIHDESISKTTLLF
jgi:hypothetical protein